MLKPIVTCLVTTLALTALFAGCEESPEQKAAEARDKVGVITQNLKEARTEYRAEWAAFKHESEVTIAANEKRIDAFKEKMDDGSPALKTKYSKKVAALEEKNRELKQKLEEYKDGGESNWEEFKTNFKHDLDAVGTTVSDLFKDND